jgi:hypothetical protein
VNTAFSHALRVTICASCGAANHAATEGGELVCGVCQDVATLGPRLETDADATVLAEDQRVAALRAQNPHPLAMPDDVSALTADGVLAQENAEQAVAIWQLARKKLSSSGNDETETKFYFLTRLLYEHMLAQGDDLRLRGVVESALDTAHSHRYRQVFRCMLACEAARVGDLTAAGDWLAPCDPRATDIHADSVWRYTMSYIATHKKQYAKVLRVLGNRGSRAPIARSFDAICTVLRANAHERSDALDEAVIELADGMLRVDGGTPAIEQVIRTSDLTLCRRSFIRARGRVSEMPPPDRSSRQSVQRPPAPAAMSPDRKQLLRALPWLVLCLGCLTLAALTDPEATTTGGQRLDLFFLLMGASFALPLFVMAFKVRSRTK